MKLNRLMGIVMALMLLFSALGAVAEAPEAAATPDPNAAVEAAATPDPNAAVEAAATPDPNAAVEAAATPDPNAAAEAAATPDPNAAAVPEEPTATPEPTPEPIRPLYIVMTDCGWTLYGEGEPGENSVVTAAGDPDGLVLSFVEHALPKLVEPDAQMMIFGYNDELRSQEGIQPVNVSDAEAIGAQAKVLRALTGRQSSLLNVVLDELTKTIDELAAAGKHDIHLMIFSGGAVNYGSENAMNKIFESTDQPHAKIQSVLGALREKGVKVSSYVWDLTGSERLRAEHTQLAGLQLNAEVMGDGCAMISGSNAIELVSGICDSMVTAFSSEEFHPVVFGPLAEADLTMVKSNDVAVILTAGGVFEVYKGETASDALTVRKAAAAESDIIRMYSAVNMTEKDRLAILEKKLNALTALLDAGQDGALDAVLEVNGEAVTMSAAGNGEFTFTAEPADAFSVTADADNLIFAAQKSGEAKLIVASADGSVSRELSVTAVNYGVTWNIESGAVIYAGESADIAVCADTANTLAGTVKLNDVPVTDAQMDSRLLVTPAEAGKLTVSLSVGGKPAEERTFAVHYRLGSGEEAKALTMKVPYFKVQEGQTVQLMDAQGNAVSLEGFAASESALADIYFNENGDTLFITPEAAGAEAITLTHEASGQTVTLNLTVNSLFSDAMFWVLAAGVPVCLIGLTAMIVLLIVKLGGKRR